MAFAAAHQGPRNMGMEERCSMTRRLAIVAIVVAALAAVAILGYAALVIRPVEVRAARSERDVPVQVFGLGTVEAQIVSSIGFEVGAALVELTADHGDRVAKGALLARLHPAEQEARQAKAQAGLNVAEAALGRARAAAGKARVVMDQKAEIERRQQTLADQKVVSVEQAEEAEKDLKVAIADQALAEADWAVARAAVETARADLAYETILLDHHRLVAPFDALVVARHMELGTVVRAGDPVFTLADPDSVWILAHVDESRAGAIALGQPAQLRLRSMPGRGFKGRVVRIGIESDRVSEERRVWVKCDDCPPDFHLGEQAEVLIEVAVLPEALLVAATAVTGYDNGGGKVWAVQDGKLRRMDVRIGHQLLDGRLQVTSDVPEGVGLVAEPAAGLREGRAAAIAEDAAP